jgi:hypothetical protein
MSNAYIAYVKKNGTIKSVYASTDGAIDCLGIELYENYKCMSEVKDLVKFTISSIEDGEVEYMEELQYLNEDEYEYELYENKSDYISDMDNVSYYYLYEGNTWIVSQPNQSNFLELEDEIEEGCY